MTWLTIIGLQACGAMAAFAGLYWGERPWWLATVLAIASIVVGTAALVLMP